MHEIPLSEDYLRRIEADAAELRREGIPRTAAALERLVREIRRQRSPEIREDLALAIAEHRIEMGRDILMDLRGPEIPGIHLEEIEDLLGTLSRWLRTIKRVRKIKETEARQRLVESG